MVDFGSTLKKLRLQENLTQQELANRLGVTKSVVSYYELQERYPSPEILTKLASVFHVTTDYLLGLEQTEAVDLAGLDEEDIITVKRLISSLRAKNKQKQ
ncbi:MAG: helix-turn-helix transcriptional regulator [Ruminococcaceae bacterium]|nr:helix-turn-helix transcriptional regulator [Oscillospiraceae bacterium]